VTTPRAELPLGPAIGDDVLFRLSMRLGRRLSQCSRTVVSAESCTGGLIAKVLTDVPGSSRWFLEGWVTYNNRAKIGRLGVRRQSLVRKGAVSERVVREMVAGALSRSGADFAVAVTGIAGPDGGVPGKPVGTVWLGWAARRAGTMHVAVQQRHFRGGRDAVRRKSALGALHGLLKIVR
jgi:nicotinamide-nucleotide amidase